MLGKAVVYPQALPGYRQFFNLEGALYYLPSRVDKTFFNRTQATCTVSSVMLQTR